MSVISMLVALGFATVSLTLLRLAWRLIRFDSSEYEKSRARYKSLGAVLRGEARVKRDTVPDGRVRAGLVYNKKLRRFEANGKLSNQVVDRVLA
jgi:hypothetical protein